MVRPRRTALGLGLATALLATGCGAGADISRAPASPNPGSGSPSPDGGSSTGQPMGDLLQLQVAEEGPGEGYDRDEFGTRWKDIDRNGCGQRNDVLARDLEDIRKRGRCDVVAGVLHDPYTGKRITFAKSDAAEVQIDHIYPLALAWRMGAAEWTEDRRERFANDHANLLAAWEVPNRQKSDSGPGEWKPRKAYQCEYAVKYIAVAKKYTLAITRADRGALRGFLGRC